MVSEGSGEEEGASTELPPATWARGDLLPACLGGTGCFCRGLFLRSSFQPSHLSPGCLLALAITGCSVPCLEGTQGCHLTSAALSPQCLKAQ